MVMYNAYYGAAGRDPLQPLERGSMAVQGIRPFHRSLALDRERRGQRRRSPLDAPSHAAMLLGLAA